MKKLLLIAALGAAAWFALVKFRQNAVVQQAAQAPEAYTKSLQGDAARAKQVAEQANQAMSQTGQEVQKAVDADK